MKVFTHRVIFASAATSKDSFIAKRCIILPNAFPQASRLIAFITFISYHTLLAALDLSRRITHVSYQFSQIVAHLPLTPAFISYQYFPSIKRHRAALILPYSRETLAHCCSCGPCSFCPMFCSAAGLRPNLLHSVMSSALRFISDEPLPVMLILVFEGSVLFLVVAGPVLKNSLLVDLKILNCSLANY